MKNNHLLRYFLFLLIGVLFTAGSSASTFAQPSDAERQLQNRPVDLKSGEKIFRGEQLKQGVKTVAISKVFANPQKWQDREVEITGIVTKACKKEGCWLEFAESQGKPSFRMTFGDHKFFVPLNSAGLYFRAQGKFKVENIPAEKVEHLIRDDGAKFENRNADGSVTIISFDAVGIELRKKG
ncbi:MAG TPA: DUF4920 domain-containing protein [Pyrinomonadaceae bacterium]|jgi:hypothetical protein|nr:DUF4920 domain-containing protein [Pyrinomonadaceae bacterium]